MQDLPSIIGKTSASVTTYSTYYNLIHEQFMQPYTHNRYERHYVISLPSRQVWTRFMYIYIHISRKLHSPSREHLSRYLWVVLHDILWNVLATSLARIQSKSIICQWMSRHFRMELNIPLNFISNHCAARRVAHVRQPLLQVCIKALYWAAIHVL